AHILNPVACILACLAATMGLGAAGPNAKLHVEPLSLARGQALFVRGPTGRTVLIVAGSAAPAALAHEVAQHLGVWEHKLDAAVALDPSADRALSATLMRYPADQLIRAGAPELRVDLEGGRALDVSEINGAVSASVVIST